jgi:hypothetical protein
VRRFTRMRLSPRPSVLLSVVAYFAALGTVIVGGAVGAHTLLSNAEKPSFLVAEPFTTSSVETPSVPVIIKPYSLPTPPQASWKPALTRGYVARPKAVATQKPAAKEIDKNQKTKASKHYARKLKLKREAMDAYAASSRRGRR